MAGIEDSTRREYVGITKINPNNEDTRIGLVIVLAITSSQGPAGTSVDEHKVAELFRELNYAVWVVRDPHVHKIEAALKVAIAPDLFPPNFKYVIVYYTGHGGSDTNGKGFIEPLQTNEYPDRTRYFIQDQIISKFEPKNAPHLQSVKRLFFFDCCLNISGTGNSASASPHVASQQQSSGSSINFIPPSGYYLVAYATTLGDKSFGNYATGGKWTEQLCENIRNYNMPITAILDKTWSDLVKQNAGTGRPIQAPHYISSVSTLSLRGGNFSDDFYKNFEIGNTSNPSLETPPQYSPRSQTPPRSPSPEEFEIEDILDKVPDQPDLIKAIQSLARPDAKSVLRIFARQLCSNMNENDVFNVYNGHLEPWIKDVYKKPDEFFDDDDESKVVTWGKVHIALHLNKDLEDDHLCIYAGDRVKNDLVKELLKYLGGKSILTKYGRRK